MKAHEKQIYTITHNRGNANSAVDQDGNPTGKPVRTKHNKCQHQMYNKRRRARKAQTNQNKQNNKNNAPAATVIAVKTDQ